MKRRFIPLQVAVALGIAVLLLLLLPSEGAWRWAKAVLVLLAVGGAYALWKFGEIVLGWVIPARLYRSPRGGEVPTITHRRDGSFEWQPRGQPQSYAQPVEYIRHRWWDIDGAPRLWSRVRIEVSDAAVGKPLQRATRRALRSATRALPGRGQVRASAAVRDVEGPTSVVSVRLMVRGIGADESWARAASEAFAARMWAEVGAQR